MSEKKAKVARNADSVIALEKRVSHLEHTLFAVCKLLDNYQDMFHSLKKERTANESSETTKT